MACSLPLLKDGFECRQIPKDCEGQVRMGFTIVTNAFKAKVKSLEDDLRLVSDERGGLEEKLHTASQRIAKLERDRVEYQILQEKVALLEQKLIERTSENEDMRAEFRRRESEFIAENKRLAGEIAALKKKASTLESFRRMIYETMRNEDTLTGDTLQIGEGGTGSISQRQQQSSYPSWNSHVADFGNSSCQPANSGSSNGDSEGRRLFRTARTRLSSGQFERFVDCVKRLNARVISPDDAMLEMEAICGGDNLGLFQNFKELLQQRKGLVEQGSMPTTTCSSAEQAAAASTSSSYNSINAAATAAPAASSYHRGSPGYPAGSAAYPRSPTSTTRRYS